MAAIAIANGFRVVVVGLILANAVGLEPGQFILSSYAPLVKIIRLSSLDYSIPSFKR